MKIYRISDDTCFAKEHFASVNVWGMYAGIRQLIPVSEAIEFWRRKREFLEHNNIFPGLHIEDGTIWPDFLGCNFPPPGTFLSERVVDALKSLDANFGALIPAPIAKVSSKKLEDSSPPDYFAIRPLAGIEVAWGELNYVTDAKGEVDRAASKPLPYPPKEIAIKKSSWSGEPVFTYSNWGTAGIPILITEQVKDVLEPMGFSNAKFEEIPTL